MRRIRLHEPQSIDEACELLAHYGEAAQAYAGGTELLLLMKLGVVHFEHLVNLKAIGDLKQLSFDEGSGWLTIGAGTTHRELELSPLVRQRFPTLATAERQVANVRVRNTGTLGGNLCFADPHSDPSTLLLALGAELVLQRGAERRMVPIGAFFTDAYETVREADELLVEIRVPLPGPRTTVVYERFCFYERPTANVALVLELAADGQRLAGARLAVGSAGPLPMRLTKLEAGLEGLEPGRAREAFESLLSETVDELEILEDVLGAADYKRQLVRVLARRALERALEAPAQ